jgi:hypothetical protein
MASEADEPPSAVAVAVAKDSDNETAVAIAVANDGDNDEDDGPAFARPTTESQKTAHKAEPKEILEIEAEVDANIFAQWINNGVGLAALSMSAFLIFPARKDRQLPIAYGFAVLAILVFGWSTAVYYSSKKRHWTLWILFGIVVLIIIATVGLLVIL